MGTTAIVSFEGRVQSLVAASRRARTPLFGVI
jgi:hypothetical protein